MHGSPSLPAEVQQFEQGRIGIPLGNGEAA